MAKRSAAEIAKAMMAGASSSAPLAGDFEAFVRRARHLRQIELDDTRTAPKPKGFACKGLVLRRS